MLEQMSDIPVWVQVLAVMLSYGGFKQAWPVLAEWVRGRRDIAIKALESTQESTQASEKRFDRAEREHQKRERELLEQIEEKDGELDKLQRVLADKDKDSLRREVMTLREQLETRERDFDALRKIVDRLTDKEDGDE